MNFNKKSMKVMNFNQWNCFFYASTEIVLNIEKHLYLSWRHWNSGLVSSKPIFVLPHEKKASQVNQALLIISKTNMGWCLAALLLPHGETVLP